MEAVTGVVVTWKVAEVAPGATVTVPGTLAAALLLEIAITAPAAAAAPVSVTVPVELAPPTRDVGFSVSVFSVAGVTVRVAVLPAAVIVADVELATGNVLTTNVPLVVPAATVTVAGTVATLILLLDNGMITSAAEAADKVTVPVEVLPPTTDVGLSESEATLGGVIESNAV